MAFDWQDYLDLADDLSRGEGESMHRSAVSRAYYAALNHARQFRDFNAPGYVPLQEVGPHEKIWLYFRGQNAEGYRRIEVLGSRLKAARITADYQENVGVNPATARHNVQIARNIIDAINLL